MRPSLSRPPVRPSRGRPRRTLPALVAILAVVLAGCSSARGEQGGDGGGSGGSKAGGTLHVGTTVDLVPAAIFTNSNDTINLVIGQVYDSLVDYPTDSLEPEPRLATKWRTSADGLTTTVDLRDDVTFHDGKEFTSKDVETSIKAWADPKWTVQFQRTAAAITGFDTSDPHRIVLTLDHPLSNIVDLFDVMPIIDGDTLGDLETGKAYNGTGPFEFVSWKPQSRLEFERNDDYWDGAPKLAGVEVKIVPDAQSLVSQLRSGQLDVIQGAGNRDLESLAKSGDYEAIPFEGSERQTYVGTNVSNPVLKDVRVRQAIAYAVDRDRIVDDVYRGVGYPISLPWPKYSPAYDEAKNNTYQRDVAKAKSLVAKIGTIPTLPLEYSTANPNNEAIAQIVQADLADVGIKVELQPNENATHIERLINGEFSALWILDHAYAQYSPSTLAVTAYPFNADKNSSNFDNAKYKRDAETAWELPKAGSKEAVAAYARLSDDLLKNLFLIEMSTTYFEAGVASYVKDLAWTKRSEPTFATTWLDK
jgi:peptide/nickel transport system substrate-binding protein